MNSCFTFYILSVLVVGDNPEHPDPELGSVQHVPLHIHDASHSPWPHTLFLASWRWAGKIYSVFCGLKVEYTVLLKISLNAFLDI